MSYTYYDILDRAWAAGRPPSRRDGRAALGTLRQGRDGDVSNPFGKLRAGITVKDEYVDPNTTPGDPNDYAWHHDLALYYEMPQRVRLGLWDRWQVDENGDPIRQTYEMGGAREFRYDPIIGGMRARYIAVDYDTAGADPNDFSLDTMAGPICWTDYDGPQPYGDVELEESGRGWDETPTMRYFGTAGQQPLDPNGVPLDTQYYHGDLVGSTNLVTDDVGAPSLLGVGDGIMCYTAFGEILCGTGSQPVNCAEGSPGGSAPEGFPRYQYAGGWGYETGGFGEDAHLLSLVGVNPNLPPITLQHVGHRWYQGDIGRFVQRDPIGVFSGPNRYAYGLSNPLLWIYREWLCSSEGDPLSGAGVIMVIGGTLILGGLAILGGAPAAPVLIGVALVSGGSAFWGRKDIGALSAWCVEGSFLDWQRVDNPYPERKRGAGGTIISGTPPIRMFPPRREIPRSPEEYPPDLRGP